MPESKLSLQLPIHPPPLAPRLCLVVHANIIDVLLAVTSVAKSRMC